MQLYDEIIQEWLRDLSVYEGKVKEGLNWRDTKTSEMVLRSDMAIELGEDMESGLGTTAITSNSKLVDKDEIIVYGPDLNEIKKNSKYARITIVRVNDEKMGEGNILYNSIRQIEYVKYHINPEGYMIRISSSNEKERIRISKEAVNKGITFGAVGKLMIDEYHKNKHIEAVKLIFITLDNFDYKSLQKTIRKSENITKAIDHILNTSTMNCNSCSLQKVCDEVEGMKELHFGLNKNAI